MFRKAIALFLTVCILGNLISINASASSQLVYNDVTNSDDSTASSTYVTVNFNNTIIASTYSNDLLLHDANDFSIIEKIELQRRIYDIEFSPDGKNLAISIMGTSELIDSVLIYDMENMEMKAEKERVNIKRSSIDWTPDGQFLAVANFQNGVNLIEVSTMNIVNEYSNQHQTDVTCIKYSNDGNLLITGDQDGNLKLWNYDGTFTGKSFQLNGKITGCGFNSFNQRISAVSEGGNVSAWIVSGGLLHQKTVSNPVGMLWSETLDKLYVLESGDAPRMLELDGSNFNELSSTYFIHKATDFDMHTLGNGLIEDLYIATDTEHISNYAQPKLREGYGESGSDLDGDNIPDDIDNDDDGDSILDEWDFNCPVEVIECYRSPDVGSVRNVKLKIEGDSLIIDDTFTFGLYESAEIRNLTRRSVIADQQISYEEANLLENAICQNIDSTIFINSWKNTIELSVGEVANGTIECIVTSGLVFSGTFDPDGIKLVFRIAFDIIPMVELPLDLTITEQISHSDSSITHLVENHPIFISRNDVNSAGEGQIWWVNDGSISITFSEEENVEKSLKIYNFLSNKINLSVIIIIISTLLFVIIRRRNKIAIDLDDEDEEYEEDELGHTDEKIVTKPKPISYDEDVLEVEDDIIHSELNPTDDWPSNRKTFSLGDEEEVISEPKRRRVRNQNQNKQGPIMTTKRKVLGGDIKPKKTGKVNVKSVKKSVKTRKVRIVRKETDDSIE
ncbi:MAG: WD40 repeat domain-containing protein [Candidatus Poseidoniaceae archaeon]